jgi:hypothetical protein
VQEVEEMEAAEEEDDQVRHLSLFYRWLPLPRPQLLVVPVRPLPRPAPPPPAPPAMIKKQAVVEFCCAFNLYKYLVQSCRRHERVKHMVFKNQYVMQGKM